MMEVGGISPWGRPWPHARRRIPPCLKRSHTGKYRRLTQASTRKTERQALPCLIALGPIDLREKHTSAFNIFMPMVILIEDDMF